MVKTRPRNDVLVSELREDFFDILLQLPGDEAALTEAEWQAVRKAAGKPLQLE